MPYCDQELTDWLRIYKAKYMDDPAPSPASPKKTSPGKEKKLQQAADSTEAKDSNQRPARSRARSLWGRKKDKP